MQCDLCGDQEATVHLTEIINDQTREIHLCEPCAKEKGVKMEPSFGLTDLLSGLADLETTAGATPAKTPACPQCGMRFEEFKRSGRLGCGACYEAFHRQLGVLLERVHGATRHAGKVPATTSSSAKLHAELGGLKARLRQAVKTEAFEEAAHLRDQIRHVEQQLQPKKSERAPRRRGTH